MGTAVKTLISKQYLDGAELNLNGNSWLEELPGQTRAIEWNKLRKLARFVPLIVLIPEGSVELEMGHRKQADGKFSSGTARPSNLLRVVDRSTNRSSAQSQEDKFAFGAVTGNFAEMTACRDEQPLLLSLMEWKTLRYMLRNPRRVISRDELLNEVWGYQNYPCTRTVDNHILRLRQKLEKDPARPVHFQTVHGVGYKFMP